MIFGLFSPEKQKAKKFKEIEKDWLDEPEMLSMTKASWLTSRGNHYYAKGNLSQAISDFKEAIEINYNYIAAYLSLAFAYSKKEMFHEALQVLNDAPRKVKLLNKETSGFEFDIYFYSTIQYLALKDAVKAREYALKALEAVNNPDRQELLKFNQKVLEFPPEEDDAQKIELLNKIVKS